MSSPHDDSTLEAAAPHRDEVARLEKLHARVMLSQLREQMFDRREPENIGRFKLRHSIGSGGFGLVFLADDPELQRPVAVKLLDPNRSTEQARIRVRREAQALAQLNHPNVLTVHEVGVQDDQVFIAMEYVEAGTLADWLERNPPGSKARFEEVVDIGLAAARGLAAAHEQGILHRDIKPANILVDEDGRPRLADFGLARSTDPEADQLQVDTVATASPPDQERPEPSSRLTATGQMMGTPAYMAPEQFSGTANAASDQFGLCATLWEVTFGTRALQRDSLADALETTVQGPPDERSEVPRWWTDVLRRGLEADPERRWPSVTAMIDAIERGRARRSRWLTAGAVAAPVVVGAVTWAAARTPDDRCTDLDQGLVGTWDEARKAEVKSALKATGLGFAEDTSARVEARLEAYARQWVSARTTACRAHQSGERSDTLADLGMACLDRRLRDFRALVDVLGAADESTAKKAISAAEALPALESCADPEVLLAEVPVPDDPAVAARWEELSDRLAQSRAERTAGRYAEALAIATDVVEQAQGAAYRPVLARALVREGLGHLDAQDYEPAKESLLRAHALALKLRMHDEAASTSAQLLNVVGVGLSDPDEAQFWARQARPLAEAAGTDEARADVFEELGAVAEHQSKYDEAREHYTEALRLLEESRGPDGLRVASLVGQLGSLEGSVGNLVEARALHSRAAEIRKNSLGPDHPTIAGSHLQMANLLTIEGDVDGALAELGSALGIFRAAMGPRHPDVATTLHNLGTVLVDAGKLEEALEHYFASREIYQEVFGHDHQSVAMILMGIGNIRFYQGRYADAETMNREALAIYERVHGPVHEDVARVAMNIGTAVLARDDRVSARAYYDRALAIHEEIFGPTHHEVADVLGALGNLEYFEENYLAARRYYEREYEILVEVLGPTHPELAQPLTNLAMTDDVLEDFDSAAQRYNTAIEVLEAAHGPEHVDVARPLTGLGEILLEQKRPTEALPYLERALTLRADAGIEPMLVAQTEIALARALWDAAPDRRDRSRAVKLARQARAGYLTVVPQFQDALTGVESWLATHQAPATP